MTNIFSGRPWLATYILLLMLLAPNMAWGQRLSLSNLVVDNQEGRIKVRFGLDFKEVAALREALAENGSLMLDCRATLGISREYSWNKEVAKVQLKSPLDQLGENGSFEIKVPGANPVNYRGKNLDRVLKEAWGELTLDLGDWSMLPRGQDYVLDLDIHLTRQNVPSWVKGALFFLSFDAVAPAKYRLDFSY